MKVCPTPGCPNLVTTGKCPACTRQQRARTDQARGNAASRGYDRKWARNRARYLKAHPTCTDCSQPATIADHAPLSRRQLLDQGDEHPDAWHHLQPRCTTCHNKRTAAEQPGGWNT